MHYFCVVKLICIGRNYVAHAHELGNAVPEEPVLFIKPDSAVLKNNAEFYVPEFSNEIHYEVEILVKICKTGKYIQPEFANNYYNEIGLGIDFTARDIQNKLKAEGKPWEKAKAFDGAALIGKFYPKEQFNTKNLSFGLLKNNELVQQGNTSEMLFSIDELLVEISKYFTLKQGDIIFTGTPKGVGKVEINDVLKGILQDEENFSVRIK